MMVSNGTDVDVWSMSELQHVVQSYMQQAGVSTQPVEEEPYIDPNYQAEEYNDEGYSPSYRQDQYQQDQYQQQTYPQEPQPSYQPDPGYQAKEEPMGQNGDDVVPDSSYQAAIPDEYQSVDPVPK